MGRFSLQDRILMIKYYYGCDGNITLAQRKWSSHHKNRPKPDNHTFRSLVDKFEETGEVTDRTRKDKGTRSTSPEVIAEITNRIAEEPRISTRRLAQEVGISRSTVLRLLKKDMKEFAHKVQSAQRLTEHDMVRRFNFAVEMCEMIDQGRIDVNKIIFSDEAHFWLDGYVNRQNYRFWGSEKPSFVETTPLHPQKLTVFCAISSDAIYGPIFIRQTVDADVYEGLLTDYFLPEATNMGWMDGQHWFQQDGAPPHTTAGNLAILHEAFGSLVIAHKFPDLFDEGMAWPLYSPDLSVLDFFLWGYVKDKIYKNKPKTLAELENAIEKTIREIPRETCARAIGSFEKRLRMCVSLDGGHIENVIH